MNSIKSSDHFISTPLIGSSDDVMSITKRTMNMFSSIGKGSVLSVAVGLIGC